MKFLILFVALFAFAYANDAVIEHLTSEVNPESYAYSLKTSDGITAEQSGHLDNAGTDHEAIVVKGSYEHVAPDGVKYTVHYTADENGFHPEGAHIPHL